MCIRPQKWKQKIKKKKTGRRDKLVSFAGCSPWLGLCCAGWKPKGQGPLTAGMVSAINSRWKVLEFPDHGCRWGADESYEVSPQETTKKNPTNLQNVAYNHREFSENLKLSPTPLVWRQEWLTSEILGQWKPIGSLQWACREGCQWGFRKMPDVVTPTQFTWDIPASFIETKVDKGPSQGPRALIGSVRVCAERKISSTTFMQKM